MKKVALPLGLLICCLLAFSCTNYRWAIPRCEWINADAVEPLPASVLSADGKKHLRRLSASL